MIEKPNSAPQYILAAGQAAESQVMLVSTGHPDMQMNCCLPPFPTHAQTLPCIPQAQYAEAFLGLPDALIGHEAARRLPSACHVIANITSKSENTRNV